jgi:ADP-heptose:LPS heptosyltransferase
MISPVINWFSETYPKSKLDIMIGQYGSFVFEQYSAIDKIFLYNKKSSVIDHIKLLIKLRKNRYDLIVVLEVNSHYKILAYLISSKIRIGISGKLNSLLHFNSLWDKQNHTIINNLNVISPLLTKDEFPSTDMSLYLSDDDIEKGVSFLKEKNVNSNQIIIFIQVACGPVDILRPWPPKRIAELADLFIEKLDAAVILNSGPNEELIVNEVLSLMHYKPIINTANINITAALIKLSNVIIGPDTGTLHIANALKKPLVALFGPTSVIDVGPIGSGNRIIVIDKKFDCGPCGNLKESKNKENCIKQRMSECMLAISVDEVYSSTLKIIK